mmetsp:Transcript_105913/g.167090  ORF Transcript_105913/g.167090 Transcript_105913/m.167090 type:complete len:219 (+) Transcript_105913:59-715(+)
MAYGLHKITSATYQPYGSGRDWFFLGDPQYKKGRNGSVGSKIDKMPSITKGMPKEMLLCKASHGASWKKPSFRAELHQVEKHFKCQACPQSVHGDRWRFMRTEPRAASEIESDFVRPLPLHRTRSEPTKFKGTYETTSSFLGRYQGFDADKVALTHKYSAFSEVVNLPEQSNSEPTKVKGTYETTSSCFGKHLGFDADKSGFKPKYSSFSEAVHLPEQ